MLDFQASRWLLEREKAQQAGNDHPTGIPSGVFPTSDRPINIAAPSPRIWSRFCDAIGKPEWKDDPRWNTPAKRSADRVAINAALAEITRTTPSALWIELFEEVGVPSGPINTIDQVFEDPQVQHLQLAAAVQDAPGMKLVASPLNIVGVPKSIRSRTPTAGQHTAEILRGVGYSDAEMQALRERGAIG
jgi:formyl-CoA transferase